MISDLRSLCVCVCFKGFMRFYSLDHSSSISVLSSESHKVRKSFFSEFSWVFSHDFLGGKSVLLFLVNIYKIKLHCFKAL